MWILPFRLPIAKWLKADSFPYNLIKHFASLLSIESLINCLGLMASIEPPSAGAIPTDRDIPIAKATPRAIREAARVEPLKGSRLRVPGLSNLSV